MDGDLVHASDGSLVYAAVVDYPLVYKYTPPYVSLSLITSGTLSFEYFDGNIWRTLSYTPGTMTLAGFGTTPPSVGFSTTFTSGDKTINAIVYIYPDPTTGFWSLWRWSVSVKLTSNQYVQIGHNGNDANDASNPPYPLTGSAYYLGYHQPTASAVIGGIYRSTRNITGLTAVSATIP